MKADGDVLPQDWAPYVSDTISMEGRIRKPVNRGGHLWVTAGSSVVERGYDEVYRVVHLDAYESPHPDLPLPYRQHCELPATHPWRYSYEGMLVRLGRQEYVLTDEHLVPQHPMIKSEGGGWRRDPAWDIEAIVPCRSPRSPYSQPSSRQLPLFEDETALQWEGS